MFSASRDWAGSGPSWLLLGIMGLDPCLLRRREGPRVPYRSQCCIYCRGRISGHTAASGTSWGNETLVPFVEMT